MQRARDAAAGIGVARLHQRLPRLAARHGRPAGVEGGEAARRGRRASSCRRSTRSSARRRCSARSASSPIRSAPPTASSRCGTARARASTAPATRSSTATPTARRRTAACSSSPATTTAASRRRCRTRATRRCSRGTCRCWRRPTSPSTWSSASTAGRCRASRATGSASPRCRRWSRAARRSTSTRRTRRVAAWKDGAPRSRRRPASFRPADGLHYRWPDLPSLKIEAAPARQARRGARVREGQLDRPRHRGRAARDGRHRHLRQGALRPARGLPPPRHPARRARRRRRAPLQGRPRLSARADAARRLRRRPRRDPRRRGEGRPRRAAAARPLLQPRRAADDRRQARRQRPAARLRARRAAAVAPDRDRRRAGSRSASRSSTGATWCVDFTIPELLSNEGDAVKRVPYFCAGCPHNTSTKVPEGSRAQAGIGCHFMASWMDRDTEGLIQMGGEGVDWVSHAMFTKVPHVFQNLGDGTYYHSGYLAIRQAIAARHEHHLQDPLQRRRRDDRRPAGRRHDHGRRDRAPGRGRGRDQGRRAVRRHRQVRRDPREVPGRHRVPRPRRARRGAAAPARAAGRDDPDLRADLRRREAPPPEEGRAGRSGAPPLHQRARLRRLRRLLGAVELRRRAAARDRAGPQAQDRPVELQQGLLLRQGLLPELRRRRRRPAEEAPGRAGRRRRAARFAALVDSAAAAGAARLDRPVRPARHRRRRHRRRHRRRADRDGGAPRRPFGERPRLHGLRAEGRLGALVRSPGAATRRR